MLKRTLFFSNPYHLSVRMGQLEITDKKTGEIKTAPIEDLGFVVFDNQEITFTQSVMTELAANNTAVIICNNKHLPASMMFHLDTNHIQNELFRAQVSASEPLKKQLWQQTVKQKIRNQAAMLDLADDLNSVRVSNPDRVTIKAGDALRRIATEVKSGDITNQEAQASRRYWSKLFGETFTREREGMPPNPSLNYGYAILRAAVARALCGSGLLPTLGIFHHNKYNHYCLADDIMEPYRPYVDKMVWEQKEKYPDYHNLDKERKAELLSVLSCDVIINGEKSPLLVAVSQTTASLVKCFSGEEKQVAYPIL
ncbi:MAG: type II CRISPR-associated endonuclease Cas1 [Bacteroidetes bacterium]|nr:type II CRISPR-associated endonuclease Cas1 [Bacteroidota bacterium]